MMNKFHQYHMISLSPWPILASIQTMTVMSKLTSTFSMKFMKMNYLNIIMLTMTSMMWWKNTIKEAEKEGFHQKKVTTGLKMGMLLFITSEIMFFLSFFWSFFHSSISPNTELGQNWPPAATKPFNPVNVPLLNTLILISSGVSITWAHHSILKMNMKMSKITLGATCLLGLYFSLLQSMEYMQAEFSLTDATYGSVFFMATGFHGIHVLVGTTFLITNLMMINNMKIDSNHHIGFEMAAWYWHFVDVVWLFLYLSVYWWGK